MCAFQTQFTDSEILELDEKYAAEGVPFHARPFRAAVDILGNKFSIGVFSNPDVGKIADAYARLIPEVCSTWPGMGTGFISSNDRVKRIKTAVIFGTVQTDAWQFLQFSSHEEWEIWCRNNETIAAKALYAFADLSDFIYGIDDLNKTNPSKGINFLILAAANLEMVALALENTGTPLPNQIQPIHLIAELSMKGFLRHLGVGDDDLKKYGHKLISLSKAVSAKIPHSDDIYISSIVKKMPDFVEDRYNGNSLNRMEIIKLALGVQFIAGSVMRRISGRNFAKSFSVNNWPAARETYFNTINS